MKKILRSSLVLTSLVCFSNAFAVDLLDAYHDARQNDPQFRAAISTKMTNEEALAQARAGLFPTVSASAERSFHNRTFTSPSTVNHSNIKNYQVDLVQPIFNYRLWVELRRAKATVKRSVAEYNAAEQDLLQRIANAYFEVLLARDNLRFTRAEKRSNDRQLDQAKERFKVGLDAVTSVYDAQAAYDAVSSREITARNNLINSLEALREITGVYYDRISATRSNLPLLRPEPDDVERWVDSAKHHNNTLMASYFSTEEFRENISAQRSQHLPEVNLAAEYSDRRGASLGSTTIDTRNQLVALQVNAPIFQGGAVFSKTRQARYEYETAMAKFDRVTKQVVSQTRQAFNSIRSGISAVIADRQAVKSASSSMESTEAAYKVGTRTIVDVLDKQRDLYNAQRKLSADQYAYIKEIINLKLQAGTLSTVDLEEINSWLVTPTAHTTMERFNRANVSAIERDARVAKSLPVMQVMGEAKTLYKVEHTQLALSKQKPEKVAAKTGSAVKTDKNVIAIDVVDIRPDAVAQVKRNKQVVGFTSRAVDVHNEIAAQLVKPVAEKTKAVVAAEVDADKSVVTTKHTVEKIKPVIATKKQDHSQHAKKTEQTKTLIVAKQHDQIKQDSAHHEKASKKIMMVEQVTGSQKRKEMYLQVGTFSHEKNADNVFERLHLQTKEPVLVARMVTSGKTYFVVRLGPFNDAQEITQAQQSVKASGITNTQVVLG